jgi:hypothetical protein
MVRFFLILCAVVLGSSRLHAEMTMPVPRSDSLPKPLLVQEEPYCELGYGTCGGACNEEGKKSWDCPAETMPCYQKGQRCTCETADICKPKKKKKSELSHSPAPSSYTWLPAIQQAGRTER